MNAREQVLKTLNHEEPDRIPYTEHLIENPGLIQRLNYASIASSDPTNILEFLGKIRGLKKRLNKLLPKLLKSSTVAKIVSRFMSSFYDFYEYIGVDFSVLPIAPYSYTRFLTHNIMINDFGHIYELKNIGGQFGPYYIKGAIKSEEIYDNFPKPDIEQPIGFAIYSSMMKHLRKTSKDKNLYVAPGIFNGIFDSVSLALGIENFSRILIKDQSFLRKIIADRERFYLALIKKAIDLTHTDVFMIGDDLAYNSGPFISPRYFNKFFLPSYKRISNMVHKRGVKLVFHSDGNILPLLDGLLDCFDSIHPWQASANIDIFKIKREIGDKICLEGNVPIELLVHGKVREIIDYVKKLIKVCGPGGGYMLSSGNSIVPEIPYINYYAMLSTFRKYRNYPIRVD